jgi:hypothetical protein
VPRPDSIDRIHEAHYEVQFAPVHEKAAKLARYEALVNEEAAKRGVLPRELTAALHSDFKDWRKQNGLPKVGPHEEPKASDQGT